MCRVLVVDDERDIANVLQMGLQRAGFDADVAYDSNKALEKFIEGEYDVVLLDVMMPGMDGYALYRKMLEINPDIKTCFLTGFDIPHFSSFKQEQYYTHVSVAKKPISMNELVRILRTDLAVA